MAGEHLDKAFRELAESDGESTTASSVVKPSLRLVRCTTCKSLEEIPDYKGDPQFDLVLDDLVRRHEDKHRDRETLVMMRVNEDDWKDPKRKREIHKSIWKGVTGFTPEYYATRDTYKEDAAKCFRAHNFSVPCIDWRADSKRIGNPSKAGWKAAVVKIHICDFCAVKVKVQEAQRNATGRAEM